MRPNVGGYCTQENGTICYLTPYSAQNQQQQMHQGHTHQKLLQHVPPTSNISWSQKQPQRVCFPTPPTIRTQDNGILTAQKFAAAPTNLNHHQQHQFHHHQQQLHHQQQHNNQLQQQLTQNRKQQTPAHYPPSNIYSHAQAASTLPPSHNYAKLPPNVVNQQRINECAGIPLISNASAHLTLPQRQRMLRKTTQSPSRIQQKNTWNLATSSAPAVYTQNGAVGVGPGISQLAAHAQGVPLLQNIRNNTNNWLAHSNKNNYSSFISKSPPAQNKMDKPTLTTTVISQRTLCYQNSAPAAPNFHMLTSKEFNGQSTATPNDAVADEITNVPCLPRIIKPRKRRKKDRKPSTNGVFLKLEAEVQHKLKQIPLSSTIKTHKSTEDLISSVFNAVPYSSPPSAAGLDYQMLNGNNFSSKSTIQRAYCLKSMPTPHLNQISDVNGICFCHDCDPLRSIWDYPLRRSLSDSSATSISEKSSIHSDSSTSSSSTKSLSLSSTSLSSYSTSSSLLQKENFIGVEHFSPITITNSRADIVGIIGSNRVGHDSNQRNSNPSNNNNNNNSSVNISYCLSDSNDSGYGDILSGINIADNLFTNNNSHTNNQASTTMSPTSSSSSFSLIFPETAETLLTESINEITRKLIETCADRLES